jgi:hypothetical protein
MNSLYCSVSLLIKFCSTVEVKDCPQSACRVTSIDRDITSETRNNWALSITSSLK